MSVILTSNPKIKRPNEGAYAIEYKFIQRFCNSNPLITDSNYHENRFEKTDFNFLSAGTKCVAEAKQRTYEHDHAKYSKEGWFLEVMKLDELINWYNIGYTPLYINTFSDGVTLGWDLTYLINNRDAYKSGERLLPLKSATVEHPYGFGKKVWKEVYYLPVESATYQFKNI